MGVADVATHADVSLGQAIGPQIQELIVLVRVERIRRGRRLPDVEYISARPRRREAERPELNGLRGREPAAEFEEPSAKLRLPWQVKSSSESV